jgi:N-acetylglutamate synthase-like GNAT family acetyltransferase
MAEPVDRGTIRSARPGDVEDIVSLVNAYATEGLMLPRHADDVLAALDDYVVVVDDHDRVLACGAVREYSPSLAEVSAIAVSREAQGRGLGRHIVQAVEALARRRGIGEVFALTLAPRFFEALGYRVVDRTRYPEKMRRDCAGCARRFGCAEVCMQRRLDAGALEAAA